MANDIKVVGADTADGDLLVTFSDQSTTLFKAEFLYNVRHEGGNSSLDELEDADRKD